MSRPPSRPKTSPRIRNIDRNFRRLRRKAFEVFGSDRYSRRARGDLDAILEQYLPDRGFFIEAGANDGVSESNSYFLERVKGWRGVLVEPIPELYRKCVKERPRSTVFQCALVADDHTGETVEMRAGHLFSVVRGSLDSHEEEDRYADNARSWFGIEPYDLEVPARTLTSILDEVGATQVDFLSLDVEGYEVQALEGLDFDRFAPRFLLTEFLDTQAERALGTVLEEKYRLIGKITDRDLLFERKD